MIDVVLQGDKGRGAANGGGHRGSKSCDDHFEGCPQRNSSTQIAYYSCQTSNTHQSSSLSFWPCRRDVIIFIILMPTLLVIRIDTFTVLTSPPTQPIPQLPQLHRYRLQTVFGGTASEMIVQFAIIVAVVREGYYQQRTDQRSPSPAAPHTTHSLL